jgi:hypothetical protein
MRRSVHFQAKLNENDEDQNLAIEIIERLQEKGFNQREILVMALMALDRREIDVTDPNEHLNHLIEDAIQRFEQRFDILVNRLETGRLPARQFAQEVAGAREVVSDEFRESMLANQRQGRSRAGG